MNFGHSSTATATTQPKAAPKWRANALRVGCGVALLVLGARLLLLAIFGNEVPYWDEWIADAQQLFKPLREGTFSPQILLAFHNEHRLFWTRLIALGSFQLAGRWDPLFEQVFNAFAFAATAGICACQVVRESGKARLAIAVSAVLFLVPFSYSNLLLGFQTHYFLAALLAVVAFSLFTREPLTPARTLLLLVLGGASLLVDGSGIALPIVLALAAMVKVAKEKQNRSVCAVLAVGAGGIVATGLHFGAHVALPTWSAIVTAAGRYFSWPAGNLLSLVASPGSYSRYLPSALRGMMPGSGGDSEASSLVNLLYLLLAGATYAPIAGTILQGAMARRFSFSALACAWVALCAAAMACARSGDILVAPRYQDILMLALFCGAFSAAKWTQSPNRALRSLSWGWFGGIGLALAVTAAGVLAVQLPRKNRENQAATALIQRFLEQGDEQIFENQPPNYVPWPTGEKQLAALLSDSTVRSFLPVALYPEAIRPSYSLPSKFLRRFIPLGAVLSLLAGAYVMVGALGRRPICAPVAASARPPCRWPL